ncbi:MAG: NifU family protein [Polyangiales bacterium]
MRDQAEKVIAEVLRPLIEADGGHIELLEVSTGHVVVRLTGACGGCPGKPYTLGSVIEPALRRALGQDIDVEVV